MKIEKISDTQIRCTLTSDDLAKRQLRISELAYGTEKAKNLFRDMMQQANYEFGFEADNIPLMIEAIPVNSDSLILVITKVEDPEELDNRFSKFTTVNDDNSFDDVQFEGADDIIDLFHKVYDAKTKAAEKRQAMSADANDTNQTVNETTPPDLIRMYRFGDIDCVIDAAGALQQTYRGENALYREHTGDYLLVAHQSSHTPEEFNKVCNILSEYGIGQPYSKSAQAHLSEHEEQVLMGNAIQRLFELQ